MSERGKRRRVAGWLALLTMCAHAQVYVTPSDRFPPPERVAPTAGTWFTYPEKLSLGAWGYPGWPAEAEAGRAQAAVFAGDDYTDMDRRVPDDCGKAIEWYRRAHELGSELAAYKLGVTYSTWGCEHYSEAAAIEWFLRAARQGDRWAPKELARLEWFAKHYELSETYSVVADAIAQEIPEPTVERLTRADAGIRKMVRAQLDAPALERAAQSAAAILDEIRARAARFAPTPAVDMDLEVEAPAGMTPWLAVFRSIDDVRECESNLVGNCRGVARLAYVEFENRGTGNVFCRLTLDSTSFPAGTPHPLVREGVFEPRSPRRLILGRISDKPDADHVRVECRPDVASH